MSPAEAPKTPMWSGSMCAPRSTPQIPDRRLDLLDWEGSELRGKR